MCGNMPAPPILSTHIDLNYGIVAIFSLASSPPLVGVRRSDDSSGWCVIPLASLFIFEGNVYPICTISRCGRNINVKRGALCVGHSSCSDSRLLPLLFDADNDVGCNNSCSSPLPGGNFPCANPFHSWYFPTCCNAGAVGDRCGVVLAHTSCSHRDLECEGNTHCRCMRSKKCRCPHCSW